MDLVASAEGGAQTADCDFRQRSANELRMLMHTVRSSGWCSLVVLNELASARVWSLGTASRPPEECAPMDSVCWLAAVITSAGMVRVCWSWALRSRGSVRTDIAVTLSLLPNYGTPPFTL